MNVTTMTTRDIRLFLAFEAPELPCILPMEQAAWGFLAHRTEVAEAATSTCCTLQIEACWIVQLVLMICELTLGIRTLRRTPPEKRKTAWTKTLRMAG